MLVGERVRSVLRVAHLLLGLSPRVRMQDVSDNADIDARMNEFHRREREDLRDDSRAMTEGIYRGCGVVNGVMLSVFFFFFQAEDGIRDVAVTGVQTCALPI